MSGIHASRRSSEAAGQLQPVYSTRPPFQTFKCVGPALFRSDEARDYASLLDIHPATIRWACRTVPLVNSDGQLHYIDLVSEQDNLDAWFEVKVPGAPPPPAWVHRLAVEMGACFGVVDLSGLRKEQKIANARELAGYAHYRARLGDRVALLAVLQDAGTLRLAECLSLVREGNPMGTVAALIFSGFIEADLDDAPIGPDTAVRLSSE